jgi:hypothetical protein
MTIVAGPELFWEGIMVNEGLEWLGQGDVPRMSFCVSFVRHGSPDCVFAAFGALPESAVPRTLDGAISAESTFDDGYGPFVRVGRCEGWLFAWENASSEGMRPEVLRRLSQGTEVVAVRHVLDGCPQFAYAADGTVITSLAAMPPVPMRSGSEPDRFLPLMREVGLDYAAPPEEMDEENPQFSDLEAVLALAQRAFELSLSPQEVEAAWPCARILPRLKDLDLPGDVAHGQIGIGDPVIDLLLRYATPEILSAVLAQQAQFVLSELALAENRVIAEAVEAALAGRLRMVLDEDALGLVLRGLARDHYVSEQYQLKGSATGWVPPEEQRLRAARADAVDAIRALATTGGEIGLAQVLAHRSRWAASDWRAQVIEGLRGVEAPREELDEAERQRQELITQPRWQAWPPVG